MHLDTILWFWVQYALNQAVQVLFQVWTLVRPCIESRFEADRLSGEKDYSSMKNIRWRLLGFTLYSDDH